VEDLDRQILPALAEDLLVLLLYDLSGAVMRVDDVVADREGDALRLTLELEVLDLLDGCLGNGGPPCPWIRLPDRYWVRSVGSGPRD
jgi:hypothetical protein